MRVGGEGGLMEDKQVRQEPGRQLQVGSLYQQALYGAAPPPMKEVIYSGLYALLIRL